MAIAATAEGRPVVGLLLPTDAARVLVDDRHATGQALDGERVIRLPRRMLRPRWYERSTDAIERVRRWLEGKPAPIDLEPEREVWATQAGMVHRL